MSHPYGCCVLACSAVFGVFLTVLGALVPRLRIGDCMKCCCWCHCRGIPSSEALDDRLYWVEIVDGAFSGTKCAAWRNSPEGRYQWTVSIPGYTDSLNCIDETVRVIHEIIQED